MTTTHVSNILATYALANSHERANGLAWYFEANTIARELGNGDVAFGAALLAVLSPLEKWERNVAVARHAVAYGYPYPTTGDKTGKVTRLLSGENPADVVSGPKVTAFYNNILDPSGDHVTIDRHAIDIAFGVVHTDKSRPAGTKKLIAELSTAYRDAAKTLNIVPLELQAITWVAWRRMKGIK